MIGDIDPINLIIDIDPVDIIIASIGHSITIVIVDYYSVTWVAYIANGVVDHLYSIALSAVVADRVV